jgi:hypothetical protein
MKWTGILLFMALCLGLMITLVCISWPYLAAVLPPDKPEKVSALIAFVYTLITFATLLAVVGGALIALRQLSHLNAAVSANTVQLMTSAHRELMGKLIEKPELYAALIGDQLPTDGPAKVYLSMIVNHGLNAFILRQHGYIDDEWWKAIIADMRKTLGHGGVRQWWHQIRDCYPRSFQEFIDSQILN